jgi:flagellar protein FliO/FliZ
MLSLGDAAALPGYGAYLLQTTLALLFVSGLAALLLRALKRRGIGAGSRALRVVARLQLEPRRALYVIEAAGRYLLVGVGDGPMTTLGELDAAEVRRIEAEEGAAASGFAGGFGALLKRALGRGEPK